MVSEMGLSALWLRGVCWSVGAWGASVSGLSVVVFASGSGCWSGVFWSEASSF